MFKVSKGEHPHLVCEKMLLNSFQTVCDGAERASEHAQDMVWRRPSSYTALLVARRERLEWRVGADSDKSELRYKVLRTRLRTGFA